jgi:hypothetical protein
MHMAQTTSERRRHHRRTVIWKAALSISWQDAAQSGSEIMVKTQPSWCEHVCWVRNLSTRGMLLQSEVCLMPQMAVAVTLPNYGRFDAFVAWSCGVLHGIAFVEAPDYILARFGQDAAHFGMTLHPEEVFREQ